ncbi:MAG: ABC transporter ATP-binding protein [Oscillospiraceae bacterium]|nr:ABC transporter ATP-binding protein [Oscillospiraceae bacterium]
MSFLEVKDLSVIYTQNRKTVHAVNGVSFTLEKGKTLGLVGETGAGKTTIAKAIMRILPDIAAKITGGEILVDGENVLQKTEEQMREFRGKKAAMIFQDPMTALNPLMTVGDQILEVLLLHNDYDKKTGMEKAGDMLEMVGIPRERYVEYPHQFSGGMKQRVVIAMALACDPELLLADEPTTALDVTIQAQVLDLIRELKEKYQTSMILITHDLGVVAETCDTVAVIYAGKIVEYGSLEDVFDHPTHSYTKGLFGSLPGMAVGEKRLRSINGLPPDPTNLPCGCAFSPRCPNACDKCRVEGETPYVEVTPGHFVRCVRKEKTDG